LLDSSNRREVTPTRKDAFAAPDDVVEVVTSVATKPRMVIKSFMFTSCLNGVALAGITSFAPDGVRREARLHVCA
jgi:hypothetical protein